MNTIRDRFIIGIMSLGYLAISICLLMMSLGWTTPIDALQNYLADTNTRWILGISAAALFIFSLTFFMSSIRKKPAAQAAVHETSLGQIKITLNALENLVLKAAQGVKGIRDVKPLIKTTPEGLFIEIKVQVVPDISIPDVIEELQRSVRDYLKRTAGITTQEIKVRVNKVSWAVKSRVE